MTTDLPWTWDDPEGVAVSVRKAFVRGRGGTHALVRIGRGFAAVTPAAAAGLLEAVCAATGTPPPILLNPDDLRTILTHQPHISRAGKPCDECAAYGEQPQPQPEPERELLTIQADEQATQRRAAERFEAALTRAKAAEPFATLDPPNMHVIAQALAAVIKPDALRDDV